MKRIYDIRGLLGTELTDILALDDALLDGTSKTLTSLYLVTVVASTVEKTVTSFQSFVDDLPVYLNIQLVV